MAEVQRGNVFLTIDDYEINKYMAKGFSVVDEKTGKVIRQSIPTELGQLQKAYSEHVETINKLTAEINDLKAQLNAVKAEATPASAEPAVEDSGWDDWQEEDQEEDQPVKSSKKKKA